MKTMMLVGGDLAIGTSSDYQMVSGPQKVQQDIRNALLEPLANDRFHPAWGSSLSVYVGLPIDDYLRLSVTSEVNRVVGNYAAVQRDRIESDILSSGDARYTTDEILSGVTGIDVKGVQDTFQISIGISTVAGQTVEISEAVSS